MRKRRIISLILVITLVLTLFSNVSIQCEAAPKVQTGITLDCARKYYSVDDIKKYIRLLSGGSAPFIQLHLSDDQNVGIECSYLKQTVKNAKKCSDGSYKNKKTKKKFLSKKQVGDILQYANKRGVAVIPEIDMPAHMGGFFKLAKNAYGSNYIKQIRAKGKDYSGELRISSKKAVKFAKKIYTEYAELFSSCTYFHIGCDEFLSGSKSDIVNYINTISKFLQKKGFTVRIWNDLLRRDNIAKINHKLQITYWSFDGDTTIPSESKSRRKVRASASALIKEGFDILNYNSYYLYFTPSATNCNKSDREYMVRDLKNNWNLKIWDGDGGIPLKNSRHVIGAAVSVWGEDASGVSAATIYKQVKPLYKVMQKKAK